MRLLLFFLFMPVALFSQETDVFSGKVLDAETGESLISAAVFNIETENFSYSDVYGGFSIEYENSSDRLEISFLGYKDTIIAIEGYPADYAIIYLRKSGALQTVEIIGKKHKTLNKKQLTIAELKNVPTIGGIVDVVKSMQTMPGISASQEGRSALTVRGGNPGQNQYLIDNVPLIYVNHLGGFLSVFNTEMINGIDMYNGVFPSKYSSSLSSILSIYQKEGNYSEWKGTFQIGLLEMNGSVEGPISENISLMIAGRKTFTEFIMLSASSIADGSYLIYYGFHDLNAKLSYRINDKNTLYLNAYQGDDYLGFRNKPWDSKVSEFKNNTKWGNTMVSSRYKSVLNNKLSTETILGFTHYRLKNTQQNPVDSISVLNTERQSSISNMIIRSNWQFFIDNNQSLDFGFVGKYIPSTPLNSVSDAKPNEFEKVNASVAGLYTNYRLRLWKQLNLNLGIHGKQFNNNRYSQFFLEPRVEIDWTFGNVTWSAGYMRVSQESHLLTGTGGILPNEVWIPASKEFEASYSDIGILGAQYFHNNLKVGVSLYYKEMKNLITYLDAYSAVIGDNNWRQKISSQGKGRAYGVEVEASNEWDKLILKGNYTYARSTRIFDEINNGESYNYNYNRPHQLKLLGNYTLNEKWRFNAFFTFTSGLPYTEVLGKYLNEDINNPGEYYEVIQYGKKNSARFIPYHKLDISAVYSYRTKKRGRKAEWTFSINNVYARQNPFHYYLNVNNGPSIISSKEDKYYNPSDLALYQISYFPFIPSFSYKIYFGTETKPRRERKSFKEWFYDN